MNICLKTQAKQNVPQRMVVKLQDRLPEHISSPCELSCEFQVECVGGDYYLLTLKVTGSLEIRCQRCLNVFQQDYSHQSQLAICQTDEMAETLMANYECTVANDNQVHLIDILTDDLHLFSPEKHQLFTDCDTEISRLIGGKDEILTTTLGLEAKTR